MKDIIRINISEVLTILLLGIMVIFSNCKKENEILTSKTWKIGVVDQNPSSDPPGTSSYNIVRNCDKDDLLNFDQNGFLTINKNENRCDQNEIQIETLNYTLNRTTGELTIDGVTYVLVEETYSQVKYYITVPKGNNLTHRVYFLLQ